MARVYPKKEENKPAVLKRGSLYWNKGTNRVERVVEFHKNIVWTSWHKEACLCFPKSNIELADQKQVNDYLGTAINKEYWVTSDINKNIEFCNFGGKMFMRIKKGVPICLGKV